MANLFAGGCEAWSSAWVVGNNAAAQQTASNGASIYFDSLSTHRMLQLVGSEVWIDGGSASEAAFCW